LVTTGVCFLNK